MRYIKTPASPPGQREGPSMKALLNTREICEYLRISRSQFYRMVRENCSFPVYQVGGRWKADPDDLEEWVKAGRPAGTYIRHPKYTCPRRRRLPAIPPAGWQLNIPRKEAR